MLSSQQMINEQIIDTNNAIEHICEVLIKVFY